MATECNFSNYQAIATATINAAKAMGIEEQIGSIEEGKKANMVVLNYNPIEDINNTRSIYLTIKNGKIYKRD